MDEKKALKRGKMTHCTVPTLHGHLDFYCGCLQCWTKWILVFQYLRNGLLSREKKKFGKHCCINVSEFDISTDMETWEWNYTHVDSTLSCLAYITPCQRLTCSHPEHTPCDWTCPRFISRWWRGNEKYGEAGREKKGEWERKWQLHVHKHNDCVDIHIDECSHIYIHQFKGIHTEKGTMHTFTCMPDMMGCVKRPEGHVWAERDV